MKLNYKRTILVGFAFMLITTFWQMYDGVVAKILVNTFGLNQTWSGVLMALDNLLALILLPLFGLWSDRTNTKLGRRTPYILVGTIVAAVFVVALGLIDYYQYQAVNNFGISAIMQTADHTQFYFTYPNELGGIETVMMADKGDLSLERSKVILANVTKKDPTMLILFVLVLLVVLVAMSSFRTPAVSLMPDVTPKPLRSKANAIINLMGTVGGIIALGYMTFLTNETSNAFTKYRYIPTIVTTSIVILIMLTVFLSTVREKKWVEDMQKVSLQYNLNDEDVLMKTDGSEETNEENSEETGKKAKKKKKQRVRHTMDKKVFVSFVLILSSVVLWFMGYNAATSKFSLYATDVLNQKTFTLPLMVAYGTALVAFIPIGFISSKFGRRKTILAGIIIMTTAFVLGIFARPNTAWLMYITMGVAGIGWATINVNSYPMVVELASKDNVGVFTGYYYTASMAAQIITPILSGAIMDAFGSYKPLFYYSAIFCGLSFVTMFFVKHGDAKKIDDIKLATPNNVDVEEAIDTKESNE
ncbi:MAG: MFS transporter [Bacilli bacterium]|jgi:maltose/moltooligosaccharide transporter